MSNPPCDAPLCVLDEVGSTNDEALAMARGGAPSGAAVMAHRQLAGRGQHGRSWVTLAGTHLYLSAIYRPTLPLNKVAGLTLEVGNAVADALASLGVEIALKWPNDVMLADKKVGGVLCELHADLPVIICGVGLNVTAASADELARIEPAATTLSNHADAPVELTTLARAVHSSLRDAFARYESAGQPNIDGYSKRLWSLGKTVRLSDAANPRTGTVRGLSDDGGLLVQWSDTGETGTVTTARIQHVFASDG